MQDRRTLRAFFGLVAAAFLVLGAGAPGAFAQPEQPVAGTWLGVLEVGPMELRIVFNIQEADDGALSATIDSPDQGAHGIPVERVSVTADSVTIIASIIAARFDGVLKSDATQMNGFWAQGGQSFSLDMTRVDEVPVVNRPQEPDLPYPYEAEEVYFPNQEANIELAGTLTMPRGPGPHPAVVLISGSGPQDRDETLMNHRPFLILADYLTRRGIAVLRHDDRGVGASTGDFAAATTRDFASDALAAVRYLNTRDDIDVERIGLLGHSEGGLTAPMAARTAPDSVAFMVLLAAPAVTGEEILYAQDSLIALRGGASQDDIALGHRRKVQLFEILKSEPDLQTGAQKLDAAMRSMELTESEREELEAGRMDVESLIAQQIQILNSVWFRYFLTYDPIPALEAVRVPVLALTGEKDVQVPSDQNVEPMRAALERAPTETFVVRELPDLNHLFQTAETGLPAEYGRIEETFDPAALEVIGDWMMEVVGQ